VIPNGSWGCNLSRRHFTARVGSSLTPECETWMHRSFRRKMGIVCAGFGLAGCAEVNIPESRAIGGNLNKSRNVTRNRQAHTPRAPRNCEFEATIKVLFHRSQSSIEGGGREPCKEGMKNEPGKYGLSQNSDRG
jgi:hypothetical protein